jgi:DNA-directed RNA polymerase beta' subunit
VSACEECDLSVIIGKQGAFLEGITERCEIRRDINFSNPDELKWITLPHCSVLPRAYESFEPLSHILGISASVVADIIRAKRGISVTESGISIITIEEYKKTVADKNCYICGDAISKMLEKIDLATLCSELDEKIRDEQDVNLCRDYIIRKNAVLELIEAGLEAKDLVLRRIPVPPFVCEARDSDGYEFFRSRICYHTFRIWQRSQRLAQFSEAEAPILVIINERRMLEEHVDKLFAAYEEAGVTFFRD